MCYTRANSLFGTIATDCTIIAADHFESAGDEFTADAVFLIDPTVDALTGTLDIALKRVGILEKLSRDGVREAVSDLYHLLGLVLGERTESCSFAGREYDSFHISNGKNVV